MPPESAGWASSAAQARKRTKGERPSRFASSQRGITEETRTAACRTGSASGFGQISQKGSSRYQIGDRCTAKWDSSPSRSRVVTGRPVVPILWNIWAKRPKSKVEAEYPHTRQRPQYARKANQTGSIFRADIRDLQMQLSDLYDMTEKILIRLNALQG